MKVKAYPGFRLAYNRFCVRALSLAGLATALFASSFWMGGEAYDRAAMIAFAATFYLALQINRQAPF